jgi:membrane fusion protein, copper/silver efflux system
MRTTATAPGRAPSGAAPAPPRSSVWRRVVVALRIAQVRLRFFLVLAVAFLVVGKWDVLQNHWNRLTRSADLDTAHALSSDTEYFCPMCPGVVSDWPSKCPVCNMALVRRKRGEAVPLPDGVVARMQLSPYRVQLAGIQTSPVEYRPLVQEVTTVGVVEAAPAGVTVAAEVFEKDLLVVTEGRAALVACEAFLDRPPFAGTVRAVPSRLVAGVPSLLARVEVEDPRRELRPGMAVTVCVRAPVAELRPFAQRCALEWRDGTLLALLAGSLGRPAGPPSGCGMAELLRASGRQVLDRHGLVPAVPETAVVDTGLQKVVYVESGPGMFDGVEVVLGPRCAGFYPVLRGLEAGRRVATAGAFLINAETRLNPSLAAGYFGASRSPERDAGSAVETALSQLAPAERALAVRQKLCPVTGQPLGSMGTPVRVVVEGRTVLLCCAGCEAELRRDPARYLAKLPAP